MLFTLSTTAVPATDLGYVLHKNPARAQSLALAFGTAHVFYPDAGDELRTAALLVEIDPIGHHTKREHRDRAPRDTHRVACRGMAQTYVTT